MRPLTLLILASGALLAQVLQLDKSPYARLHDIPVKAVTMGDGFWSERRKVNVEKSLPAMIQQLEQHGVVENFRNVAANSNAPHNGPVYTDSDVYKWIEAAAFVLQSGDVPSLHAKIDELTDIILSAQEPSGYLNTYYQGVNASKRFTEMHRSHELYCLGHLMQAAIAYYRATGNRKLMDGGIRFADYLVANFGPNKRPALTGHPELEMALVELYRTTGERKYLDFAGYLLSGVERERLHLKDSQIKYMFSGIPFTSRTQFEGHAVRAMYASCGATDYYAETGDARYRQTLETLWRDMAAHKMYITGGVGSRSQDEAFGNNYELPNAQAYTESCAAIANYMWNWRMLMVTGESRFTDVMERALYNGINSGMSLDGTLYCYRNPLESTGEKIRNEWYETTCCPPNIERTLSSLPGYLFSTSKQGVYVNFFHNATVDWHLEDGAKLRVRQSTQYPWNNRVDIAVDPALPSEFSLFVRIPEWSKTTQVQVNGTVQRKVAAGGYYEIHRKWSTGDHVQVAFDMEPRLTRANTLVREDAGRVAVERGPLVYCLEQADQPKNTRLFDESITLGQGGRGFTEEFRRDLLDGVAVLKHSGTAAGKSLDDEPLYTALEAPKPRSQPVTLTFIPYYAWANRGQDSMEVWVPLQSSAVVAERSH